MVNLSNKYIKIAPHIMICQSFVWKKVYLLTRKKQKRKRDPTLGTIDAK